MCVAGDCAYVVGAKSCKLKKVDRANLTLDIS